MVLVEVVEPVVDLWIVHVDIWFKRYVTGLACAAGQFALLVISDFELSHFVGLAVEHVAQREKDDEREEHHIEAAAPSWRNDRIAHCVVQDALRPFQVIYSVKSHKSANFA